MDYKKQLKFVANIIDSFQISDGKTRVAAGVFSDKYSLEIPFGDYNDTDDLKNKIQNLPYLTGGTKTHIAIRRMREEAFSDARAGVAHIAVILPMGGPYIHQKSLQITANHHKSPQITHKSPQINHKSPQITTNHHKSPTNHHKSTTNHHKSPTNHHKSTTNHQQITTNQPQIN